MFLGGYRADPVTAFAERLEAVGVVDLEVFCYQ